MAKTYCRPTEPPAAGRKQEAPCLAATEPIDGATLRSLLLAGSLTKGTNRTFGQLVAEENLWDETLALARDVDARVAFRASWALESAYTGNSLPLEQRAAVLLDDFFRTNNNSVQRIYSKLLCDMLRRKAVTLDDEEAELLAGRCFDLLTDDSVPVAVKVWQVDLLSDLGRRIGWIPESLTDLVRRLSENPECPPAMTSRAKRYLRSLQRK